MAVPLIAIIAIVVIIIVTCGFFALKSRKSAPSMDAPAAAPMPDASMPAPSMDAPPTPPPPQYAAQQPTFKTGYITSHPHVYITETGAIPVSNVKDTLNAVAALLKQRNITVPYNYVTYWDAGSIRLYNVPPGETPTYYQVKPGEMAVKTFYVPGGISVSTFGSMSHFGKSGGRMMIILIILLILGGGAYYLHTQGKLKMPTFEQRMAEFGKTIKSLRKCRR